MREFKTVDKIYIKSNNTTNKIFNRYLYCLIPFILLIVIYNLVWGTSSVAINLLKSVSISLIISSIVQYIFNIIKKDTNISKIFIEDKILTISLTIALFSIGSSIITIVIASIISIVMKNILKNTTTSSSLYGILFIILVSYFTNNLDTPLTNIKELGYIGTYNSIIKEYGTILSYSLGLKYYLSPALAIISFLYLLHKKSIKYNIVFSYVLTFIITMLSFGLLNNMNIWYLFFQITTGNILFLTVFCLSDYPTTPTTSEGQMIYGIILGIMTSILRFIIPELSVVLALILGSLFLTKLVDSISFKLKYNKKFYYTVLTICGISLLIANIVINIVI